MFVGLGSGRSISPLYLMVNHQLFMLKLVVFYCSWIYYCIVFDLPTISTYSEMYVLKSVTIKFDQPTISTYLKWIKPCVP